eukprot:1159945-Pelagomonas_calceolata.AAC.6
MDTAHASTDLARSTPPTSHSIEWQGSVATVDGCSHPATKQMKAGASYLTETLCCDAVQGGTPHCPGCPRC